MSRVISYREVYENNNKQILLSEEQYNVLKMDNVQLSVLVNEKDKEIERLNNIINKVYKYLDEKKDVPEWWDTDFMICMDMLKGGKGYLKDILGVDKE